MTSAHVGIVLQEDIGCTLGIYFSHKKLDQMDPYYCENRQRSYCLQVLEMRSRVLGLENLATLGSERDLEAALDSLPLALATAHAYLKEKSTTFRDYWRLCKASWLKLQQIPPDLISFEDSALYSTRNVSFTYIEQQTVLKSKLLRRPGQKCASNFETEPRRVFKPPNLDCSY